MTPDQAILLKTYDSETDGRARFIGHSAFEDPTTPADAPMRESIEIRTIAFFLSGQQCRPIPFSLDGKVALVTGANSDLGRAVALALRDAGALVAIGGRRTDRNARVLELLGNSAAAFELDVPTKARSNERSLASLTGMAASTFSSTMPALGSAPR